MGMQIRIKCEIIHIKEYNRGITTSNYFQE